jgi:hypothetical protein
MVAIPGTETMVFLPGWAASVITVSSARSGSGRHLPVLASGSREL